MLADAGPGEVTRATFEALASMPFDEDDPRFVTAVMCLQFAQRCDRDPSARCGADLARHLQWLADHAAGEANPLDRVRAKVAVKTGEIVFGPEFEAMAAPLRALVES